MTEQLDSAQTELLERFKQNTNMVITIGVILLIVGILSIASPLMAGLSIAISIGILLILGGIGQLFFAFKAGSAGKGVLTFVLAVLTVLIGIVMISQPDTALATLTIFLAAYFIVEGIFEIIWAFQIKPIKDIVQRHYFPITWNHDLAPIPTLRCLGNRYAGWYQVDLHRLDDDRVWWCGKRCGEGYRGCDLMCFIN